MIMIDRQFRSPRLSHSIPKDEAVYFHFKDYSERGADVWWIRGAVLYKTGHFLPYGLTVRLNRKPRHDDESRSDTGW